MLSRLWNAGYTFLVAVSGTVLTIIAVLAGATLVQAEHFSRKYNMALPSDLVFRLGLTGIFLVWAAALAILAAFFLDRNDTRAKIVGLVASLLAFLYLSATLQTTLRCIMPGTMSVTGS